MKKILLTALLVPAMALAQTFPSPTFNSLTLQNPLTAANGGTGTTTSTGTGSAVLSNSPTLVTPALGTPSSVTLTNGTGLPVSSGISGLGTGVATGLSNAVTGSGGPVLATSPTIASPTITGALTATGLVTTADLATQAANTVLANVTGSTASPTAFSMPSCSTSTSALQWASGTGFTCYGSVASTAGATFTGASGLSYSNAAFTINDTSATNGAHVLLKSNGTQQWDLHSVSSTNAFTFDRYSSGTFADAPISISGTNGLVNFADGMAVNGSATASATPVGNPFTAYSNWVDNYTTSLSALPEWGAQINMTSNLGSGQGTPNGNKVAFFSGVNQLAGSGSAWAGNFVAQSAASVGANGLIGVEIDMNAANTSIAGSSTPTAPNYTAGLAFSGAGSVPAQAAILISGPSKNWYRGIYFDGQSSGAIGGNSVEDESQATNSYLMNGTHTYGLKGDGGTFASGFITAPNGSSIEWKNSSGTLENGISLDGSNNLQLGYGGMGNIIENGNTVPVTNNALTLGTSGLQWSNVYATNVTTSGTITTGGIVGVTNGTAATAGTVGQQQTTNTSSVSLTTGTTANGTSLSVGAGQYYVQCTTQFSPAASTSVSALWSGVNTTSAALPAYAGMTQLISTFTTGVTQIISSPMVYENLSATTTLYCPIQANFAASTMTANTTINVLRIH